MTQKPKEGERFYTKVDFSGYEAFRASIVWLMNKLGIEDDGDEESWRETWDAVQKERQKDQPSDLS